MADIKMIDENELAIKISKAEGKKVEVNIAQIKEIQKIMLDILASDYAHWQILDLVEKHSKSSNVNPQ